MLSPLIAFRNRISELKYLVAFFSGSDTSQRRSKRDVALPYDIQVSSVKINNTDRQLNRDSNFSSSAISIGCEKT